MRRLRPVVLLSCLAIAAAALTASAQDPSLVMYLNFEDGGKTAKDLSPAGKNSATLMGKAKFGEGKYGSGLALGLNAHAEVPHHDSLNLQAMSLMTWVRITELTGDNQSGIEKGPAWAQGEYNLLPVYGGNVLLQIFDLPDNCNDELQAGTVTDTKWHHITGTFDLKRITVYVDGSEVGGGPCEGKLQTNNGPLYIGARGGSGRWTVGFYDDMKIYNRALTKAEIRTAMEEIPVNLAVDPRHRATVMWAALKDR
ncbi:LamG domain-containing protein [Candidatus Poribacteria bacterium]|nr:LamG domain-containing protein [Candidatus Poribacteria bacterium]